MLLADPIRVDLMSIESLSSQTKEKFSLTKEIISKTLSESGCPPTQIVRPKNKKSEDLLLLDNPQFTAGLADKTVRLEEFLLSLDVGSLDSSSQNQNNWFSFDNISCGKTFDLEQGLSAPFPLKLGDSNSNGVPNLNPDPHARNSSLSQRLQNIQAKLSALEMRYALATSHLFLKASEGETGRSLAGSEYGRVVDTGNFIQTLDKFVKEVQEILLKISPVQTRVRGRPRMGCSKTKPEIARIQQLIDRYDTLPSQTRILAGSDFHNCWECGIEMSVDTTKSELKCTRCGATKELIGTVFDDAQFYNQEGQKAKSGNFNPNRHYQKWITRILARESDLELGEVNEREKVFEGLRGIVRRDKKIIRLLTVYDVRDMLKEIGRTDLNKNVPLIMKKLTGIGPPKLSDELVQRVGMLFTHAIDIRERVRPPERVNRNYYPYYIFKIFEAILDKNDYKSRRVLFYIYLQSNTTLENDDEEWADICKKLDGIDFISTNRDNGIKYRFDHDNNDSSRY